MNRKLRSNFERGTSPWAVRRAQWRELVRKIGADVVSVLRSPEMVARMAELGMDTVGNTPEQFDALIRAEIEKWAKVVKASGARVD